jgi:hypothetical protein
MENTKKDINRALLQEVINQLITSDTDKSFNFICTDTHCAIDTTYDEPDPRKIGLLIQEGDIFRCTITPKQSFSIIPNSVQMGVNFLLDTE